MGVAYNEYLTSFKYYVVSHRVTRKERFLDDLRVDWGVPSKVLKNISARQLKCLLKNLKKGKQNKTGHQTLLSQYRREAKVMQIYK